MARHIFIVSRGHPDLYEHLVRQFGEDPNVIVILDRRLQARRRDPSPSPPPEGERRRRPDRRSRRWIDEELQTRSHAIITLEG